MYGEGHDRSARVRQIPINVEPRHPANEEIRRASSRQQHQSPNNNSNSNNNDRQNQENLWNYRQAQFDNSQRGSDHRQTSPNTSSINIDYQPHHAQRDQIHEGRGVDSHTSRSSEDRHKTSREQPVDQQHYRNQEKSPLPNLPTHLSESSNSDKKVNSPEPIPLPPPPEQQCQTYMDDETSPSANTTDNTTNDQRNSSPVTEEERVLSQISAVKSDITNLLEQISQFRETSSKSKEYRYLDEMLTRCVLNLDNIECGNSQDLRQRRRAAIKMVDQTTSILQKKLQINADIYELSVDMSMK